MKHTKTAICIIASILATGCAHYKWEKAGASEIDQRRDQYECDKEAAQIYPPNFVTKQITQGYIAPSTTTCNNTGSARIFGNTVNAQENINCTTRPGQQSQGITRVDDVNGVNRYEASKSCMRARGWNLIKVQ